MPLSSFRSSRRAAQAELGRALGGYISVVTKSGTNVLHGTAYGYLRDDRFNEKNALSRTRLPMHQTQYGGSLGGPLVSNRTFYFTNVEQRQLDQTGSRDHRRRNVSAVNARLAAVGYKGPLVVTGIYPNPVNSTNVLGKVDHQVSGEDQLSVRYSLYDVSADNSRGAGGLNAPSASSALDNLDQTIAMSNTFTISSQTVLETRAQFAHSDLEAPPTDPIGPAVSIAGVASFGTQLGQPHTAEQQAVPGGEQPVASVRRSRLPGGRRLPLQRRSHHLSAFGSRKLLVFVARRIFWQACTTMRVSRRRSAIRTSRRPIRTSACTCRMSGRSIRESTLNVGVRYDLQSLETISTDGDNVSPRVGVAWSPFDSRRTLVRGSAGLFYDRVPLRPLANAILSAGNTTDLANLRQIGVSLSPTQSGAPTFPNILPGVVPSVTLVNLTTMDRQLQNAYSRQASLEVEHQLGRAGDRQHRLSISARAESVDVGEPECPDLRRRRAPTTAAGPIPTTPTTASTRPSAHSNYHGVHLSFMQRPAKWGHYRVSYTLSKSMNNLGEFFFSSPIDPLRPIEGLEPIG